MYYGVPNQQATAKEGSVAAQKILSMTRLQERQGSTAAKDLVTVSCPITECGGPVPIIVYMTPRGLEGEFPPGRPTGQCAVCGVVVGLTLLYVNTVGKAEA